MPGMYMAKCVICQSTIQKRYQRPIMDSSRLHCRSTLNEGITPEEGYTELGDLVSTGIDNTAEQAMYNIGLEDLAGLSRELKGVEKRVLQMCLSHPEWTQKQKAKALGMSQSYESRIEKKIRSYLD